MTKVICFDMDGTIADLYAVDNWLDKLRAFDPSPYKEAQAMWDMARLAETLYRLKSEGWEIRIITWLSKDTCPEYDKAVRKAKIDWLLAHGFPFDHFHGVKYGRTKAESIRNKTDYAILIDDNAKVRKGWRMGATIDPTATDIIMELENLLN